jgi:GNAT superfamily N-acetyltransferase
VGGEAQVDGLVSVRVASESDVDVLAGLRRRWNEERRGSLDDPDFEARFRAWWDAEHTTRTFFLASRGDHPVGMANVKHYTRMPAAGMADAGTWGYVGNVFVVEEQRSAGIGRALMEHILGWAGAQRFEHLRLAPSERSIPFYARLGFVPGAVVELDPPSGP